mmetsp:Transcript_46627/g.50294  ORF Transcript_46627/g.50294 Transcript_46627/m.50294 type:complete len:100 (-) Transcript_46627:39-338(-)
MVGRTVRMRKAWGEEFRQEYGDGHDHDEKRNTSDGIGPDVVHAAGGRKEYCEGRPRWLTTIDLYRYRRAERERERLHMYNTVPMMNESTETAEHLKVVR